MTARTGRTSTADAQETMCIDAASHSLTVMRGFRIQANDQGEQQIIVALVKRTGSDSGDEDEDEDEDSSLQESVGQGPKGMAT